MAVSNSGVKSPPNTSSFPEDSATARAGSPHRPGVRLQGQDGRAGTAVPAAGWHLLKYSRPVLGTRCLSHLDFALVSMIKQGTE